MFVSSSYRVSLLATMLSLSVSGLALSSTFSQIETLKEESNSLSKAIAGLASSSGRSFPNQFEDLISAGVELVMEIAPVLKQFSKKHFPTAKEQDSQGSLSSIMTYYEKMPSPCFVSQSRQDIDRQGVAAIGSVVGGVANAAVTGVGAAASASSLSATATGLKNLDSALGMDYSIPQDRALHKNKKKIKFSNISSYVILWP